MKSRIQSHEARVHGLEKDEKVRPGRKVPERRRGAASPSTRRKEAELLAIGRGKKPTDRQVQKALAERGKKLDQVNANIAARRNELAKLYAAGDLEAAHDLQLSIAAQKFGRAKVDRNTGYDSAKARATDDALIAAEIEAAKNPGGKK